MYIFELAKGLGREAGQIQEPNNILNTDPGSKAHTRSWSNNQQTLHKGVRSMQWSRRCTVVTQGTRNYWVAVKELKLSYHNGYI